MFFVVEDATSGDKNGLIIKDLSVDEPCYNENVLDFQVQFE